MDQNSFWQKVTVFLGYFNCFTKTFTVKSEVINMIQAWEKEKSESLTVLKPMTMLMSCRSVHFSHFITELKILHLYLWIPQKLSNSKFHFSIALRPCFLVLKNSRTDKPKKLNITNNADALHLAVNLTLNITHLKHDCVSQIHKLDWLKSV